jgi:hypothetical protein
MTFAFVIAVSIQQINVQDLSGFFLSFMASSELHSYQNDFSYNPDNRSILFMDNIQPGSGSQPEAQSKGTNYNPTTQNSSLNITSNDDKLKVEGIYNKQEELYLEKKSLLNSSVTSFTKY